MNKQEIIEILEERPEVYRICKLFSELSKEQQKEALPKVLRMLKDGSKANQ